MDSTRRLNRELVVGIVRGDFERVKDSVSKGADILGLRVKVIYFGTTHEWNVYKLARSLLPVYEIRLPFDDLSIKSENNSDPKIVDYLRDGYLSLLKNAIESNNSDAIISIINIDGSFIYESYDNHQLILDQIIELAIDGHLLEPLFKYFEESLYNLTVEQDVLLERLKLAMDHGFDLVGARNEMGISLLHLAAGGSYNNIMQYLRDHGADINATTNIGRTPLHYAVGGRNYEGAMILLKWGANAYVRDSMGRTPMDLL